MRGDATEFYALKAGFTRAQVQSVAALRDVVTESATAIRNEWRTTARVSSGAHSHVYPSSITFNNLITPQGVIAEIGPDKARGPDSQAFLGRVLEFGGSHSAPHLDGATALGNEEPKAERRFDAAIGFLIP